MRNRLTLGVLCLLCACVSVCSCADSAVTLPAELAGTWVLSEASAHKFPPECRNLRLEFTSDRRLITTSRELTFITKLSIARRNGGFLIHQEIAEHNDKPNCQGKSAHYVLSNFAYEIYFERDGAILRQYFGPKKSDRYVEFISAK